LITTLFYFLLILGVLVFVHELGHFLAARRIGVRVLTFSLGFGPKLLKTRRGDTEYCISALPLGGYVKMAGETADEPRTGAPDEFLSKTKWQRFQVLIMGPVMNLLLAVVVMAIVLSQGIEVPVFLDDPPVIGVVTPGSPAERAGIQPGDRIMTVAGRAIETWEDLEFNIGMRPDRDVPITFVRGGQTLETNVRPVAEGRFEIGLIGIAPDMIPVVLLVQPDRPAERAGIQLGDELLAVNGDHDVVRTEDLLKIVEKNEGRPLGITLRRAGREFELSVTPEAQPEGPRIGLTLGEPTKLVQLGPADALVESVKRNYQMSGMIFQTLGGLFTGETSVRQLQGPVGIAQISGQAARAGWITLLSTLAIISLNLGLLNLLPVPILDGGHILIMGLEGIARRDFSMQAKEKMLLAGFVVLMMLMVTVIYNDLTRISSVERLMPWRN
jgi:regulator of sigma E protease